MAIKSYEMFVRGDWLHPSILGGVWPHSPLWHWPVILISQTIGWTHVDIAVRLVSVIASYLTALSVGFTARWLFQRTDIAWLAALIYLSIGEVAFWYGWLGYVDATFALFIFSAIAALWRALEDESALWFLAALSLISLAFLTKNITAYALFGASGLIFLWRLNRWQLFKTIWFVPLSLMALSVPVLWQGFIAAGGNTATVSINDVLRNFAGHTPLDFIKHWVTFPFVFLFRALPVSLFLAWLWLKKRQQFTLDQTTSTLLSLLLICFLPFWISAGATPRYLVPLYGIVALLITSLTLQLDGRRLKQVVMLIALFVLLKIPYSLLALPYIKDWRPERDVKVVAQEIMHLTEHAPLRTQNDVATGLAIAAYIDVWRQQRPPIHWYDDKERGVYILTEVEEPSFGQLVKNWRVRGSHIYLYWNAAP